MITRNRYNLQGDTCYQGLSTDNKPTDGVPINSLFLELDTGDFYYFDGSDWAKVNGSGGGGGGGSLDLHPKLTMNVTVHGQMDYGVDTQIVNNAFTANGVFIIFKENHFFVPEFEDLNEDDYVTIGDGETKTVISYFPYNSGASFAIYVLIPKVGFLTNIQFSNNVNCTYSVSGDVYISDIDQDASINVELTFQPND